jgi:predicted DCC family thiol-disulfide oxidoreductase YuxK
MAEQSRQPGGSHLILYDGVCGLCNRMNAFVLKHDKRGVFRFASIQSSKGQLLLRQFGRNPDDLDTFFVLTNYRSEAPALMQKARAGMFVLKALGAPWRWAAVIGFLPVRLLDFGYDCIASNRYRIFGKLDQCALPAAEHRERFVD